MTTAQEVKELRKELEVLKAQLGIGPEVLPVKTEDRADHIPHGSDKHATFLGLVRVKPDDNDHNITYTSPGSDTTYALEDEIMQFLHYPNPEQAAKSTLRQKVNVLESKPEVPEDAPSLWQPVDIRV